jgi:protein SCO1/2
MGGRVKHAAWLIASTVLFSACRHDTPAPRYPLEGQILAVVAAPPSLTIKHGDVAGLMPGMTMTFPVAEPSLLEGRSAGELVTATLEVKDGLGRLVAITHVGSAPLPAGSNEVGLATTMLAVGDAVPDAALVDQSGHRRSLSEWRGAHTVMTFIYTRCPLPNFCPLMDQNFRTLQNELAQDPRLRGHVKLVTISFDPEHDTPEVLAAHAARLHADPAVWTFLTGDRVVTDRVAARFGVGVIRPTDDPTQITHNLRTAVIGPDGRLAHVYAGTDWTPSTLLTDLRAAVRTP